MGAETRQTTLLFTPTSRSGIALYAANLAIALQPHHRHVKLVAPSDFMFGGDVQRAGVEWSPVSPVANRGIISTLSTVLIQMAQLATIVGRLTFESRNGRVVVHVLTNYVGPLQLLLHLLLKLLGARLVLTVHDVRPHYRLHGSVRRFNGWCFRLSYRLADLLHVHNEIQRMELEKVVGIAGRKILVIPHGASFGSAVKRPLQSFGSPNLRLVVIGSIRENKRVLECIEAVAIVQAMGQKELRLDIYGTASRLERSYLSEVRQRVQKNDIFIALHEGFLSEQEFDAVLHESDAVLLPYADFTSQSGVALRAIQADCFILGTPSCNGGLPVGQILGVEVSDLAGASDIAEAICKCTSLTRPERLKRSRALRQYAMNIHSWTEVARQFAKAYEIT